MAKQLRQRSWPSWSLHSSWWRQMTKETHNWNIKLDNGKYREKQSRKGGRECWVGDHFTKMAEEGITDRWHLNGDLRDVREQAKWIYRKSQVEERTSVKALRQKPVWCVSEPVRSQCGWGSSRNGELVGTRSQRAWCANVKAWGLKEGRSHWRILHGGT